ncbi:helix-turn-helix domain-containing protein [Nocardia sp. NPDC005825]|uniref:TetR/AcrR family transcriptional regulator n=1 Tax=unclassified Nocardia TaxID=2637762 RepID=UPI0033BFC4DD
MSSGEHSTRDKLLDVAEQLFAERGVDATLIGDIVQGAGQRNPSALRYHFGSRDGVLQAILSMHLGAVEQRRAQLLAQWPEPGPGTARDAVVLIVAPLTEELESASGRHYLQILGQMIHRFDQAQMDYISVSYPSMARAVRLMGQTIDHLPDPVVEERVRTVLRLTTSMLSARARDLAKGGELPLSARAFEQNLLAMATASLTAPDRDDETREEGSVSGGQASPRSAAAAGLGT